MHGGPRGWTDGTAVYLSQSGREKRRRREHLDRGRLRLDLGQAPFIMKIGPCRVERNGGSPFFAFIGPHTFGHRPCIIFDYLHPKKASNTDARAPGRPVLRSRTPRDVVSRRRMDTQSLAVQIIPREGSISDRKGIRAEKWCSSLGNEMDTRTRI